MRLAMVAGVAMGIAGLGFGGAGGYTLHQASDPARQVSIRNAKLAETCRQAASTFGTAKVREDGGVDVELPDVSDVRNTLGDMTAILAMCPYQRLMHACIGVGCEVKPTATPKVTIRLAPPKA